MANHIRNQKFIRFKYGTACYIVEIDCDTVTDLPEPPTNWLMGSIAHDISTGSFYELNSLGQWIKQTLTDEESSNGEIS